MNKTYIKGALLFISIIWLGVATISIFNIYQERVALSKEINKNSAILKTVRIEYKNKEEKINKEAFLKAQNSTNHALNTVAQQNINYEKVSKISKQFFRVYYHWRDSKDFQSRAEKLENIITPALKQDKKIFGEVKDSTGGNFIDNAGYQSDYESSQSYLTQNQGSKVQALVKVTNTGWTKDQKNAIGTSTHYYDLTYDLTTNKISNIKLVFTEKSENNAF